MTQTNGTRIIDLAKCIVITSLIIGCTPDPKNLPVTAFNGAGKITKVDTVRDEIYLDTTSGKRKAPDVYIINALSKLDTLPRRGDSMLYSVDAKTLKIDTFTFKNK